jgi:PAS domain-containing protein
MTLVHHHTPRAARLGAAGNPLGPSLFISQRDQGIDFARLRRRRRLWLSIAGPSAPVSRLERRHVPYGHSRMFDFPASNHRRMMGLIHIFPPLRHQCTPATFSPPTHQRSMLPSVFTDRDLLRASPLRIYETNAEGRCVYTNPMWSALSGLSAAESLGHS